MKANKKNNLKPTAGWRVGSVEEFLGLSEQEAAYIELNLILSEGLKKRRKQKNLTQVELAKMLRSSQSRITKMEAGDPSVSLDLLIRSLFALGINNLRSSSNNFSSRIYLSRLNR